MAIIKCKYKIARCGCLESDNEVIEHDKHWWCDDGSACPYGKYMRPTKVEPPGLVNPTCAHCRYETVLFEKQVKSYELSIDEFEEGWLTIGRKEINLFNVSFLSIDGEVFIGGDEADTKKKDVYF